MSFRRENQSRTVLRWYPTTTGRGLRESLVLGQKGIPGALPREVSVQVWGHRSNYDCCLEKGEGQVTRKGKWPWRQEEKKDSVSQRSSRVSRREFQDKGSWEREEPVKTGCWGRCPHGSVLPGGPNPSSASRRLTRLPSPCATSSANSEPSGASLFALGPATSHIPGSLFAVYSFLGEGGGE